jgi:uracil-DNA glycosylase family protein
MARGADERPGAGQWVPDRLDADSLAAGVAECRGCELYQNATHGVPGEGPMDAPVMVVGEQPGDQEDRQGRPFVGPAGKLLARALDEAGLDPETVYRTNAVKHFRWDPGRAGKRIHKGPSRVHVAACGPWLVAELDMVRPRGVVLLGATAGGAVYGPSFRVGTSRGHELEWPSDFAAEWRPEWALATTHPSAILRSRNREEDLAALVADLSIAVRLLAA